MWQEALVNVDTSRNRFIFEQLSSDTGYVVPEPAFMVSTQKEQKSVAMFRSWLKYRPILLYRLCCPNSTAQPKHNPAWSAVLTPEFVATNSRAKPNAVEGKKQRLRKEMLTLMSNTIGADFDVGIQDSIDLSTLGCAWYGISFEQLKPVHFEQILWELNQINFYFEIQALDRRARYGTPYESSSDAHHLILACLPNHLLTVPSFLAANHGLASFAYEKRAYHLFAMARVMNRWSDTVIPRDSIIRKTDQLKWTVDELDALETDIARNYCQAFHDCFQRPPIIPRRLSEEAVLAAQPYLSGQFTPRIVPSLADDAAVFINVLAM